MEDSKKKKNRPMFIVRCSSNGCLKRLSFWGQPPVQWPLKVGRRSQSVPSSQVSDVEPSSPPNPTKITEVSSLQFTREQSTGTGRFESVHLLEESRFTCNCQVKAQKIFRENSKVYFHSFFFLFVSVKNVFHPQRKQIEKRKKNNEAKTNKKMWPSSSCCSRN